MKTFYLFFSFFILVNLEAQQSPFPPAFVKTEREQARKKMQKKQMANSSNYDVKYQRLFLKPNMSSDYITGEVTTYFKAVTSMDFIEFDMADQLEIEAVVKDGNNLNFTHSSNILHIEFPSAINAGVIDSLQIKYHGVPPDSGFDSYVTGTHGADNVPVVWTLSEPYGARDWWPCKQDLSDKIDSVDVVLKYPQFQNNQLMKGVSNGILTDEYVSNDSIVSVWKHRYPIAAYLVAFAVTNYEKYSFNGGISETFPIDNFFYPENASTYKPQSEAVLPVMNFFEETYGLYPFRNEKYGQAQFGWGGGMEHQTITFLVNYGRDLMAHELGHQWFGDAITCGSWHDIWLNEGFATYSEGLIHEALDGEADFVNWKKNKVDYITRLSGGSVYVQDTTNVNRIFDYRLSYSKGAMVLNMLRLTVGNQDFFQGLKNYVNQKEYSFALTPDFKEVMQNTSGKNLDEFFNDWIYGAGYPVYTFDIEKTAAQTYKVTVHQTTTDASVDFFEMPLPLVFKDENGQEFKVILENTQNDQVFTVNAGIEVDQVEFDPGYDIITRNTTINLDLSGIQETINDLSFYPNPAKDSLHIYQQNNTIYNLKAYDMRGRLIKKWDNPDEYISLTDFAKGVYIFYADTEKGIYITKIVIEN